eukprot:scaffold667486_cov60-Prasinocladus_malaysianus.AAC.1
MATDEVHCILHAAIQDEFSPGSAASKPSLVQLRAAMDGAGLRVTKHFDLTSHLQAFLEMLLACAESETSDSSTQANVQGYM